MNENSGNNSGTGGGITRTPQKTNFAEMIKVYRGTFKP